MENLQEAFNSIIVGYSPIIIDGKIVYAKHYGYHNKLDSDLVYKLSVNKSERLGIDLEQDRLKFLKNEGLWLPSDDEEIARLETAISNANKSKKSVMLPSGKQKISENIKALQSELYELVLKRQVLVGDTCESLAKDEADTFFILNSLFSDRDLTQLYIPRADHDDLDDDDVVSLTRSYSEGLKFLSTGGVKNVALSPEAQMMISLAENAFYFYGKPVCQLTFFQSELFVYAKNYSQMLKYEIAPPASALNDPEKLEDWFDSVTHSKRVIGDSGNVSVVGASVEELKEITGQEVLDVDAEIKKAAEANGGIVSMESMLKMLQ